MPWPNKRPNQINDHLLQLGPLLHLLCRFLSLFFALSSSQLLQNYLTHPMQTIGDKPNAKTSRCCERYPPTPQTVPLPRVLNRGKTGAGTIVFKPDSMMYIGPQFVISGLYTVALMATLNSRHRISAGSRDSTSGINSVHLSNLGSDASGPRKGNPTTPMRHHGSHSVNADEFKSDVV
ncbi:hypothetical protein C8J57DRAFT_1214144 [Mycena rebaudengoi]|nr:hypothetical protein C8J57DRAFT_1214144 [Mycena rebaudengoi]